jgi:uncharacterized metal-binding protein
VVIGVPLLDGRVAPRCISATHLLLATVTRGRVTSRRIKAVEVVARGGVVALIRTHGIGTLVCGGITVDDRAEVQAEGTVVIDNVSCSAAEAVAAIDSGTLRPGFGFNIRSERSAESGKAAASSRGPAPGISGDPRLDCLSCTDRICVRGGSCIAPLPERLGSVSPQIDRLLETAHDIAAEPERQLCRVAELVYLCLQMQFARVGIAFCIDLLEPAQIVAGVLRRFVEVVPVCCKVGGGTPPQGDEAGDLEDVPCDPLMQAAVLNRAETDINVLIGLCIGADSAFTLTSRAPVTALFVKDRSLANNPIGAVYSEYYLQECVASGQAQGLGSRQALARVTGERDRLAVEER